MSILGSVLGVLAVVGLFMAGGLLALMALVLKSAATKEAEAILPTATRGFIDRARDRLPAGARPRWEEEWPAGFQEAIEKRPLWALREAIYLYMSAARVARALEPVPAKTGGYGLKAAGASLSGRAEGLAGRLQAFGLRVSGPVRALWSFSGRVAERFTRNSALGPRHRTFQIVAFVEYLLLLLGIPTAIVVLVVHLVP